MRFATFLAPCNRGLYEYVAEACAASELVDGTDWRELASGSIDVAFVCSPPLIWLKGAVEAIAAPVLLDPEFGGRPLSCSDIVVPISSPALSLADLEGKRWAINEPSSWSGYWSTLREVGSWSYFGQVITAGFHQRALRMVADGEVDGSAIDRHVLAVELSRVPALASRIRVIGSLAPAPSQPVVVRSGLDPDTKGHLRKKLLALDGAPLRAHYVSHFAIAPDYGVIAQSVPPDPLLTSARGDGTTLAGGY